MIEFLAGVFVGFLFGGLFGCLAVCFMIGANRGKLDEEED